MSEADLDDLLRGLADRTFVERLEAICSALLGVRYDPNPYGEGETGRFDRRPLARYDAFNCISYTEAVLSLAAGACRARAESLLPRLRYLNGRVVFESRCHWIIGQWTTNNVANGLLTDTMCNSPDLIGEFRREVDWPSWYSKLTEDRVYLPDLSAAERVAIVEELRQAGQKLAPQVIVEHYVPFERLFCPTSEAAGSRRAYGSEYLNERLLAAMPRLAVVAMYGAENEHVGVACLRDGSGVLYHIDYARPSRALRQDFLAALAFRHRFTSQVGFRTFGVNPEWPCP